MAKKQKRVEKKNQQKRLIPAWIWMVLGSLMTLMIGAFLYLWQPFKALDDTKEPQDGYVEQKTTDETFKDTVESQPKQLDSKDSANISNEDEAKNKPQANEETNNQDDYEFYDILPEQELTPIPETALELPSDGDAKPKTGKADVTIKTDQLHEFETYDGEEPTEEAPSENSANKNQTRAENKSNTKPNNAEENDPIEALLTNKQSNFILQINSFGTAEEADKRRAEVLLAGIDARVIKTPLGNNSFLYQVISKEYANKEDVFVAQERLNSSGIDSIIVERKKS